MTLAPDTLFAAYRIETLLGRGGMGEVYRATDGRLGRPVALKLVAPELAGAPGVRERFLAESRLAASLDHPHIVPIYEAGEADGRLFLAMRYVDGSDLGALLERDGRLAPERAVTLLRGIAEALDAAHDRGLVHRDVKPSNILVARTGRGDEHAYLADFGLVKQLGSGGGFTQSGQLLGSVDYVAPEQIEGRPIDARVDVYSLGCVLYAALSGEVPFPRDTDMATLWAHVQTAPPRPSAVDPALAPFDALLARALAKDPADRPASAGELLREATVALDGPPPPIAASTGQADVELPYVGLRAFDEADARFFVGREDDVAALLERLRNGRFLAVFGPSGSGKSSLVRAGLVPALRRGELDGSEAWPIEIVRPGSLPVETLAARIARQRPDASMGALVDELTTDSRAIHHATEVALVDAPRAARAVWVIDQAEELFTLTTDESARRAAIEALVHAATVAGGRTIVVLAMRADFYHRCATYPALAAAVADSQYLVSPLSTEALRRTIEEPARLVGLDLEPGLVETILDDVAERPGALPLLEHALVELWERRRGSTLTLAAYREAGGIEGAIAVRAEATYSRLEAAEADLVRGVFLRLVQPGEGTEDTRRRASLDELHSAADPEAVDRILEELSGARLLTVATAETGGEPVVDLAHEALLRAWPRLRDWIDEDREALRTARRIADAAAEWERLGGEREALLQGARLAEAAEFTRDRSTFLAPRERSFVDASIAERDRQTRARGRRQRVGLGVAATVAVFFVVLSGVALSLWAGSQESERRAVAARGDAEAQADTAEARRIEALGRQLVAQSLAIQDQDFGVAALLAVEGLHRFDTAEARQVLSGIVNRLPEIVTVRRLDTPTNALASSHDGTRLAVLSQASEEAGTITIVDVESWTAAHDPIPTRVYLNSGTVPFRTTFGFAPDDRSLAFVDADGVLAVLDLATGTVTISPAAPSPQVDSIAWASPTVVRWAAHEELQDDSPVAWTWDLSSGELTSVSIRPDRPLAGFFDLRFGLLAPGADWALSVDSFSTLQIFDAATGEPGPSLEADVLGFGDDGKHVVTRTRDGIGVRTLPALEPVGSEFQALQGVTWARFDAEENRLSTWSEGRTMSAFDVITGSAIVQSIPSEASHITAIADSATTTFVGHFDRTVDLVEADREVRLALPDSGRITLRDGPYMTSPDGTRLAQWSRESEFPVRSVEVVDISTGRSIAVISPDEPSGVGAVAITPDGGRLVTLHDSGRLLSTPIDGRGTATVIADLGRGDPRVGSPLVVVSPDGTIALVAIDQTRIVAAGGEVRTLPVGGSGADFLPDGALVLSNCDARSLRIVETSTGRIRTEVAVDGCPDFVDVHADGEQVLVDVLFGIENRTLLELHDASTLRYLGTVSPGQGQAGDVRFVDGQAGAAAAFMHTFDPGVGDPSIEVRLLDMEPTSWADRACELAGRNLTRAEWLRFAGPEPYRATCPAFPAAAEEQPEPSAAPIPTVEPPPLEGPFLLCPSPDRCLLEGGHYDLDWFDPPLSFDTDEGWYVFGTPTPSLLAFLRDKGRSAEIARGVHQVFDDAGQVQTIASTPEAFIAWLRSRASLSVHEPVKTTLAGLPALQVDVVASEETFLFRYLEGESQYQVVPGQRVRFILASLDGSLVHVAVEAPDAEFDPFWTFAEPLIQSIRFG